MKMFLETIDAQEPHARAVILSAIPVGDLQMVREAGPMEWLPVIVNARATEITWSALGPKAREAFFFRLGMADFDSSLLKSLVGAAIRVFGVDPGSLFRWAPRGWTQIYRDSSKLSVEHAAETSLRLRFENLPRCLIRAPGWPESVAASMNAMFTVTQRTGAGAVVACDVPRRSMVLAFRWNATR